MLVAVAIISLLMLAAAGTQLVPGPPPVGRRDLLRIRRHHHPLDAGAEGMKFFPLIFSLFMFICVSNLVGIIPYTFTISSHIIVTAALALWCSSPC